MTTARGGRIMPPSRAEHRERKNHRRRKAEHEAYCYHDDVRDVHGYDVHVHVSSRRKRSSAFRKLFDGLKKPMCEQAAGRSHDRPAVFYFVSERSRGSTVLPGGNTPILPQSPCQYTKYCLRPFHCLDAFPLRQNCCASFLAGEERRTSPTANRYGTL